MPSCKVLTIVARNANTDDLYSFEALELPSGECMVPGTNTRDEWFIDRWAVEAHGYDQIESREDAGIARCLTDDEIRESVRGCAREFGTDAVPGSLHHLFRPSRPIVTRLADGSAFRFSSVGCYPLYYVTRDNDVLCPDCAAKAEDDPTTYRSDEVVAGDAHWEGPAMTCDGCNGEIESAYGDPDATDGEDAADADAGASDEAAEKAEVDWESRT